MHAGVTYSRLHNQTGAAPRWNRAHSPDGDSQPVRSVALNQLWLTLTLTVLGRTVLPPSPRSARKMYSNTSTTMISSTTASTPPPPPPPPVSTTVVCSRSVPLSSAMETLPLFLCCCCE